MLDFADVFVRKHLHLAAAARALQALAPLRRADGYWSATVVVVERVAVLGVVVWREGSMRE